MTPQQIELVRSSFIKVLPYSDMAGAFFYNQLFTIDPSTRPLFRGDIAQQSARLMAAVSMLVDRLDRFDAVREELRSLGRHVGYGVRGHHYGSVREALLWTLEQGLGEEFTPETRDAWATLYGIVSATMIEVAFEEVPSRAAA